MKLSIVTTLYRSSGFIDRFHREMTAAAAHVTSDFEIVLVNDGSPDDSFDKALALQQKDARVRLVDLSRNFGHHKAVFAGLAQAQGEFVFLIDCDLEEDPHLLVEYWKRWQLEKDCDVVYGSWRNVKGGLLERIPRALFYWFFNNMSEVKLPPNHGFTRLCTRRYIDALLANTESEIFLAGLWYLVGFRQIAVPIDKKENQSSTYTLSKKLRLAVDAITSFSSRPLVGIFVLGLLMSGLSILIICYMFFAKYVLHQGTPGWASIVISIWAVGGLIIFSLGVVGIYISKMFVEVKRRPRAIVRAVYGQKVE